MHDLDRLVGQIYDAAVEPGRWPQLLELLSDFLEGAATKLTFQNVRTLRSEASSVRMPPEADRTYAQYYYKTNVFLPRIAKLRAGTLIPVWRLSAALALRDHRKCQRRGARPRRPGGFDRGGERRNPVRQPDGRDVARRGRRGQD